MSGRLEQINRFPVKSMRGESLESCTVEPWGLVGDRRWMVVDADGTFLSARECPRLLLVTPSLRPDGGLGLTSPDAPPHETAPPDPARQMPVTVWRSSLTAATVDPDSDAWISAIVGQPARLVYLDEPNRRMANPTFAGDDAPVSFADGYPLLITTTASLAALNAAIAAGPRSAEGPLPMIRFRPNLVVDGPLAWSEDGWRTIMIGDAVFRAVKGCDRCVITTTDPYTAGRGKEPIATLSRIRRFDGSTWFGMNLVPDRADAQVRVGDELTVLDTVRDPDGPPR